MAEIEKAQTVTINVNIDLSAAIREIEELLTALKAIAEKTK